MDSWQRLRWSERPKSMDHAILVLESKWGHTPNDEEYQVFQSHTALEFTKETWVLNY